MVQGVLAKILDHVLDEHGSLNDNTLCERELVCAVKSRGWRRRRVKVRRELTNIDLLAVIGDEGDLGLSGCRHFDCVVWCLGFCFGGCVDWEIGF